LSCTLIVEQGNPPVLQATLRDALTGLPLDAATVLVTINDASGAPVTGEAWPMALVYVTASAGVYRLQLDSTVALIVGQAYTAAFQVTVNGVVTTRNYPIFVTAAGCGDTAPADSPASPAYQPPSKLQMLNEAEAAYHQMLLGKSIVLVKDQNGEEVTYSAGNRAALAQYIFVLKAQLGLTQVGPANVGFVRTHVPRNSFTSRFGRCL
jgi:hypothetical protein